MNSFKRKVLGLSVVFVLIIGSTAIAGFGQPVYSKPTTTSSPKPLLQDIVVQKDASGPNAEPLVDKTGSSKSTTSIANTAYPVLADVAIPGYSGILIETIDGKPVLENYSEYTFNPASNVKIATAYAVLKTFGPNFRFDTYIYTDGSYDQSTGTIHGNLYVAGRDPMFNLEHGVAIAQELNRSGVQTITGDLVVTDSFLINYSSSAQRSSALLQATIDSSKRSAAAAKAWSNYLFNSRKPAQINIPSVSIGGGSYTQPVIPTNAKLLFKHESAPLREIVKATLCYSNNFLAEKLGNMLGGAYAVARVVQQNAGVAPEEFSLATSSGLGLNRVTPRAQMKLLRTLRNDLEKYGMTFADIMPVAGMDDGTLESRFASDFSKGSVVGKTGTLGNTDGGVSTLSGEINTRNGRLLFVIFNMKGSVARFRSFQNSFISLVQGQFGGAAPLTYNLIPIEARLANTRIIYPNSQSGRDE